MIKNVFIPEKIGNNYLFTKRIVGIDIGKTHIHASVLHIKGTQTTIEKCIEEKLESGPTETHDERVSKAVSRTLKACGKFDEIHSAISGSNVIFKELKLPFTSHQKISMVVGFEIEPLLPFPLETALVDFIITKTLKDEQSSIVLVAAVQKTHVAHHLELFAAAQASPAVVTVDLFGLYALFKQTPAYASIPGGLILLDFGMQTTRLAYIHDGQLKLIRNIAQGLFHIAKTASQHVQAAPNQLLEHILRFGLEDQNNPDYVKAIKQAMESFWDKIRFTFTSFAVRADAQAIQQVFLLGDGAKVKKIVPFVSEHLGIECLIFEGTEILKNQSIHTQKKLNAIPPENLMSISAALPSPITQEFNLRKDEFSIDQTTLLLKQFIVAGILLMLLLGSIIAITIMQSQKLTSEKKESEQETLEMLQNRFKGIDKDENILDEDLIKKAAAELKKEEQQWFAFSSQARSSVLQSLLELTGRIDKEALGFEAERMTISQNIITLFASVKDFDALKILERELKQSNMISSVTGLEEPKFIATITLKRTVGDE